MVRVTRGVVSQAQAAFLTSFRGLGGHLPPDLGPYFPAPAQPGLRSRLRRSSPAGRRRFAGDPRADRPVPPTARRDEPLPQWTATCSSGSSPPPDAASTCASSSPRRRTTPRRAPPSRHRYKDLIGAGVEIWRLPRHGRPRQGGRRRRRRQLRHRESRLMGALPQLGDHDDRAQRRHRRALRRRGSSSPTSPARIPATGPRASATDSRPGCGTS